LSGSNSGQVTIVDYDPKWPYVFRAEAERLLSATCGLLLRIEHIGSTAVPGLAAKPTIDLMAGSRYPEASEKLIALLASIGYRERPDEFTDRLLFSQGHDGSRTYNLHVVGAESLLTHNEILFRDRLRSDPDLTALYASLKREVALQNHSDPYSYNRAKTPFILSVVNEERAARGLPPVEMWSVMGPKRRAAWIEAGDTPGS